MSPATVSFVLNGKTGVGQHTRERVTALLVENGFTIKNHGEAGDASPGTVKFIRYYDTGDLVERNDDFITQVMEGIDFSLRQFRYSMNVVNVKDSDLAEVLTGLKNENIAGVIFLGTEFEAESYELLTALPCPVVAVDNCFRSYPVNAVDMDNIDGMQSAVQHLYQKGHRRIGYLKSTSETGSLRERSRGIHQAMHTLGLDLDGVICLPPCIASAAEEMGAYLDQQPGLPTAFFADNDVIAVGAMRALMKKGVRIPEDISIVGFDDSLIASVVAPALTTMRIFKREMGICAVRRLIELVQNQDTFISKTSVGVALVERETTAPPRSGDYVWTEA